MRQDVHTFCQVWPKNEAEAYARGLFKLTKRVKMTVEPERMASFDYNKDEAYKSATGE